MEEFKRFMTAIGATLFPAGLKRSLFAFALVAAQALPIMAQCHVPLILFHRTRDSVDEQHGPGKITRSFSIAGVCLILSLLAAGTWLPASCTVAKNEGDTQ